MPKTTTPTTGPLTGHEVITLDAARFIQFKQHCYNKHVAYGFGAKCANLGEFPPAFYDALHGGAPCNAVDCSGFARALLHYAAPESLGDMPDGSYMQGEYFRAAGLKESTPEATLNGDGIVRVGIHHPDVKDETGHIWIVVGHKGQPPHTVESWGGKGPGERPPDARLGSGHRLYELASLVFCLCEIP